MEVHFIGPTKPPIIKHVTFQMSQNKTENERPWRKQKIENCSRELSKSNRESTINGSMYKSLLALI